MGKRDRKSPYFHHHAPLSRYGTLGGCDKAGRAGDPARPYHRSKLPVYFRSCDICRPEPDDTVSVNRAERLLVPSDVDQTVFQQPCVQLLAQELLFNLTQKSFLLWREFFVHIVTGLSKNTFGAANAVTREQAVTMLWRFAKQQGFDTTQGGMAIREFDDYDSLSEYAREAMAWAVNAGILKGSGNRLMPDADCTRAQLVTLLYRLESQTR